MRGGYGLKLKCRDCKYGKTWTVEGTAGTFVSKKYLDCEVSGDLVKPDDSCTVPPVLYAMAEGIYTG